MAVLDKRFDAIEDALQKLAEAEIKSKEDISKLSSEMLDFKDEMKKFKDEINKKWSELAKKMGTLVEDIIAPNIPIIASKYFNLQDPDVIAVGYRIKHPKTKLRREFDVIAVYEDSIILNETKSTLRNDDITEFSDFLKSGEFFEYFPEYSSKTIIPIMSALRTKDNLVKFMTKKKIYAMALKGDITILLNYPLE